MGGGDEGWVPEEMLHLVMGFVEDPGDREAMS
jgi:coronatine-insensitive protein 1